MAVQAAVLAVFSSLIVVCFSCLPYDPYSDSASPSVADILKFSSIKVFSDKEGQSLTLENIAIPDLSNTNYPQSSDSLKDNIVSVCGVGVWAFHQGTQYEGATELLKLKPVGGVCESMELGITARNVSSIHQIVINNDPSIIFHQEINYNHATAAKVHDYPNDRNNDGLFPSKSIIIVGDYSWAVFFEKNFTGRSVCLVPESDEHLQVQGVADLTVEAYKGFFDGTIKSLRKGCTGNEDQVLNIGEYRLTFAATTGIVCGSLIAVMIVMCILSIVCKNRRTVTEEPPSTTELQTVR